MSTLTNDALQAIRARCEAATPGPWEKDGFDVYTGWSRDVYADERGYKLCGSGFDEIRIAEINNCNDDVSDEECLANADFAAHARTDIPALLEHIEHLNRVYTMPCPHCDFSSGQRGMDRCPHCDDTGRMATHTFVTQQRDAALTSINAATESDRDFIDALSSAMFVVSGGGEIPGHVHNVALMPHQRNCVESFVFMYSYLNKFKSDSDRLVNALEQCEILLTAVSELGRIKCTFELERARAALARVKGEDQK